MNSQHLQDSCLSIGGSGGRRQQTLVRPVSLAGVSLFHGFPTSVRLLPSDVDCGIVFRRTDLMDPVDLPANCEHLAREPRRTVIEKNGQRVETVEHLMAALAGLQVDNCVVEIDSPEVPAFDGSCRPFCDAILDAGLQQLDASAAVQRVEGVQVVQSADRRQSLVLRPYVHSCRAITYHFDYGAHPTVVPQQFSVEISPEVFYEQISAARTFVLESEIAALKKMKYGLHLTAKDILVFGTNGPIDNRLRWPDECVRHKILDCVGDLALSGTDFHGHVTATRSGHHLNHEMAKVLTMMKKGVPHKLSQAS